MFGPRQHIAPTPPPQSNISVPPLHQRELEDSTKSHDEIVAKLQELKTMAANAERDVTNFRQNMSIIEKKRDAVCELLTPNNLNSLS